VKLRTSTFSSASLEQEYQAELAAEKIRLSRILVLLAIPINLAFVMLDLWAIRSSLAEVWTLRVIITLALLGLFASTWLPAFTRWYAPLTALAFLAMGGCINAMIYIAAPTELAAQVYYGGLILIIMGLHSMTNLSTLASASVSLAITLIYAAIALSGDRLAAGGSAVQVIAHLFFFAATAIIGVVGQGLRDRYSRENYLLRHSLQRDVELKEEEKRRASYLAEHDPLTGLANRLQLERRLNDMLQWAARAGQRVAVMFVDLDDFKPVNDTHGHAVGDRVLRVLAERLHRSVEADDVVARVGGDEFVVAMRIADDDPLAIARVADRVAAAVGQGIELRGTTLQLSACVGVAAYPIDGRDLETLLHRADDQMYRVKNTGKGRISLTAGCERPLSAA
jgi:diguanylate cyclase (GGDEF)-like protein